MEEPWEHMGPGKHCILIQFKQANKDVLSFKGLTERPDKYRHTSYISMYRSQVTRTHNQCRMRVVHTNHNMTHK